jgi:hypothetical protein
MKNYIITNMNTSDRKIELKKQVGQLMKICHTGSLTDIDNVFKEPQNLQLFKDKDNKLLHHYIEQYPEKTPYILTQLKANIEFISSSPKDLLFRVLSTDNIVVFNHFLDYFGQENIYKISHNDKNILSVARQLSAKKITLHLIEHIDASILKKAERKMTHLTNQGSYIHSARVQFERSDVNSLGSYLTTALNYANSNYFVEIVETTLQRYKKENIIPNWHFVYSATKNLKHTSFDINQQFFKPFKSMLENEPSYVQKSVDAIQYNKSHKELAELIYTFKNLALKGEINISFNTYGDKSYEKQQPELLELIKAFPLILTKADAFKINKAKHLDIFIQAINQPGTLGDFEGKFSYMLLKNTKLDKKPFEQFIQALHNKKELFTEQVIHSFATQLLAKNKTTQLNFDNFAQTLKIVAQDGNKEEQYQKLFYDLLIKTQNNDEQKNEQLIGVLNGILEVYPDILYGKAQFSFPHKKTPREYHFVSFAIQSNNPSLCQYFLEKIDFKKIDEEYLIDIRRAIFRVSNKEKFQSLYEKFHFENSMQSEEQVPKKTMKI